MTDKKFEITLFEKLNRFINKYYKTRILKGFILLIAALLSFLILFALIEHFTRLSSFSRKFIFFGYVFINLFVLIKFVLIPFFQLLRIGKGLNYIDAARIIGNHFPEINDKVINLLQLNNLSEKDSGLIYASIRQKTKSIEPFSFRSVITFKENQKHLKWIALPLLISLFFFLSGNLHIIKESSARIIDFYTDYDHIKKAPFQFKISNKKLTAIQHEDFLLSLELLGKKIPSKTYIEIDENKFSLNKESINKYTHLFKNVSSNQKFRFISGEYYSSYYTLKCLLSPKILEFEINLETPDYTNIPNRKLENIGSFSAPEGTKIKWTFKTKEVDSLQFYFNNNIEIKKSVNNIINIKKKGDESGIYSISTSNENVTSQKNDYSVNIIKDKSPKIILESNFDTLNNIIYFNGSISDDYATSKLTFNYSVEKNDTVTEYSETIKIHNLSKENFYYLLNLNSLSLSPSNKVICYFKVWDNDAINGKKSAKSKNIIHKEFSINEINNNRDKENLKIKNDFDEAVDLADQIEQEIVELKKSLINKKSLGWEEKKKAKSIIEKQKKLEDLIRENNRRNQENNKIQEKIKSTNILEKQKKLEELMNKVLDEETKKLIQDLQKLLDEMDKDKVKNVLDKIEEKNNDLEKDLDRNLELYKELEFEQKLEETIEKIDKIKDSQNKLEKETQKNESETKDLSEKQKKLQDDLEDLKQELEKLNDMNSDLENKKDIPDLDDEKEKSSSSMKESKEYLEKNQKKNSSKKQKEAIENLEKMADKMKSLQSSCSSSAPMENMESLRQILENLIYLSFEEEKLINSISNLPKNSTSITKYIRIQKKLSDDAKIIEDSLFALSKRVIQIESLINKEISSINYNIEKSISLLEERKIKSGVSKQQFVMTSANNLALMLSETLNQMQMDLANSTPGTKQCNKPGSSSKPSLKELQKMQKNLMKKMKGRDGEGNSGKKKGEKLSEKESQNLMNLANQQQLIRLKLQELRDEIGKAGEKGNIDKIIKKMEENEIDILNNKITNETILRQKDILTKLLKAEESQREREEEEERESIEWNYNIQNKSSNYLDYIKKKKSQEELIKTTPINLNKFYKDKVNKYFNNISKQE